MTEVGRDARIARDRCLNALQGSSDVDERIALWRAAKRYGERMRAEIGPGEETNLRTPARLSGENAARGFCEG